MAGGTQTTYTRTDPWEPQQDYLKAGMGRVEDAYTQGQFGPSFYGAPGTMSEGAQALNQIAPGLVGFDPNQHDAMSRAFEYGMGPRAAGLMGASEATYLDNILPYTTGAMGAGQRAALMGSPGNEYSTYLPFEGDQYSQMLRGDVDYNQYDAMADAYRQQFEDQVSQGLQNVRQGLISYQPGGGSRGDIFAANVASAGQKALAQNLAGLYGGAYQQAQAGRMPAAQMGIGQQQFGMGYGLQGLQGAQSALGLYPGMLSAPFGVYDQAAQIGAEQRAMDQAALNRDIARYEYESALPQQELQSYLAGIHGDYGGLTTARGPGGTNMGDAVMSTLLTKAIMGM
tara:strand:+ start:7563 stop:8585 length:1023 start_codon:yes stop_codon:yes gene_type:complete